MKKNAFAVLLAAAVLSAGILLSEAAAEDSEASRRTLANLPGVGILVEPIQPNIQRYAQKAGLTTVQLQQDIRNRLQAAGIRTFPGDEWLKVQGRPVLYVNINTHETEKYWYAYDIRLELRQIVSLEVNPQIKTLADTWSINITGVANIGNMNIIRNDALVLVERYVQAHLSALHRK
ncbi:MAG: hypothetical protein A4E73_00973 [Syntrophaceae bacterium PtaU1.Bin231]|nr:MAG: hypothetical protein A4E73_00973 [Syntrophaceae bacterium PtaU1.Bin231]